MIRSRAMPLTAACAMLAAALAGASESAAAPAAGPVAVAVSAARPSPDARSFTVRTHARAAQVIVCDLEPFWCARASRATGRRWSAVLPTGVLPSSGPSDATDLRAPLPDRVAGMAPTFHVAAISIARSGAFRRRAFAGAYAEPPRPAR